MSRGTSRGMNRAVALHDITESLPACFKKCAVPHVYVAGWSNNGDDEQSQKEAKNRGT
ncbi:hypothetical protein [Paraburkholderia sp. DHOC27]|uniref:hypothetical protein n=1 Tax=Paraburkholderia sp. DHOC27 TaxID=2303330 RepID=UPI0015F2F1C9|nr:hypothetical protein [Paraburkholderia sp. DHOC27]